MKRTVYLAELPTATISDFYKMPDDGICYAFASSHCVTARHIIESITNRYRLDHRLLQHFFFSRFSHNSGYR
jgi:hypothetical protein